MRKRIVRPKIECIKDDLLPPDSSNGKATSVQSNANTSSKATRTIPNKIANGASTSNAAGLEDPADYNVTFQLIQIETCSAHRYRWKKYLNPRSRIPESRKPLCHSDGGEMTIFSIDLRTSHVNHVICTRFHPTIWDAEPPTYVLQISSHLHRSQLLCIGVRSSRNLSMLSGQ